MLMYFLLLSLLWSPVVRSLETPNTDPGKLAHSNGKSTPDTETVVRVKTARVVLADYDLLKKDFPELRGMSNQKIDEWLLDRTAYISAAQAKQEVVNTKIEIGEAVEAYRPDDYGRGMVFKTAEGLIDAKGTGALNPLQRDHGNGLATLGETIREYAYEKMVKKVLDHSGTGVDTVGTYGVIDFGFDVRHPDGSTSPAGSVLRQSHERYGGQFSLLSEEKSLMIEKTLREYGLTSAGAYHDLPLEKINIQGTISQNAILDFGGIVAMEKFDKQAVHFYGSTVLISPKDKVFIQPNPKLKVPFSVWGQTVSGKIDPKLDNPWLWSHELADNLRKGTAQRKDAEQHIRNLVNPVDEILAQNPRKIPEIVKINPACQLSNLNVLLAK